MKWPGILMNSQSINVILAMPHYWVIGSMPISGVRLQDLLARTNTDFISLAKAQVFSNEAEDTSLAELTEVLIPKKQILCVSTSGEEHEAPVKRLYNFQPREQSSVSLMVDNYLIEGLAHFPKTATGVAYSLYRDCGLFFPLTQATVRSGNSKRLKFPFLLVNSELLRTAGLSQAREAVTKKTQPLGQPLEMHPGQDPSYQDCGVPSGDLTVESITA
jgi:hypothetical protein